MQDLLRALTVIGVFCLQIFTRAISGIILMVFTPIDFIQISAPMAIVQRRDNLGKNFPNESLIDMFILFYAFTHRALEVTATAIFHHDENFEYFFVNKVMVILNNWGVLKFAQNIDFSNNLLLFFFAHLAVVELFPDKFFAITNAANFSHNTKGPYIKGKPNKR